MSERARIAEDLAMWFQAHPERWSAPYGVLSSIQTENGRKFRSVTFGIARLLDAQLKIWSERYILLRSSATGTHLFRSESELRNYLETTRIP